MKKMLFLMLISLCVFACKDREPDPNVLPEATQTGANTAGALVDGKVWVATTTFLNPPGSRCEQIGTKTKITLDLRNKANIGSNSIEIHALIENFEINKTYVLSEDSTIGGANYAIFINAEGIGYLSNSTYYGRIKITRLDIQNQIVSGTFEFQAVNANGNIVNITDGRFDKKFD